MRKVKGGSVRTVVMLPDPIRQGLNKGPAADLLGEIRGKTKTFHFLMRYQREKRIPLKHNLGDG